MCFQRAGLELKSKDICHKVRMMSINFSIYESRHVFSHQMQFMCSLSLAVPGRR